MDPKANIKRQIELASMIITATTDDEKSGRTNLWGDELAELVKALHHWRMSGGFDPYGRAITLDPTVGDRVIIDHKDGVFSGPITSVQNWNRGEGPPEWDIEFVHDASSMRRDRRHIAGDPGRYKSEDGGLVTFEKKQAGVV